MLDSSISGNGANDDKCITQILTLSNRTGGDGEIYVRTGRASSKNQLAGGYGWEQWAKLQQNVQVGQVTSLNSYIENGMYSGVYVNGDGQFETFVMVVINNYAVAGANGKVRSVSQFKYALALDGTFSYRSRSGQGNTGISWGEWSDLNGATTAMLQDGAVTAQKLSADVREKVDNPLRPLFIAAGAEYNDTGTDKTKTAPWGETVIHKAGHYYLNGLGDITEEQMVEIYNAGKIIRDTYCTYISNKKIRTTLNVDFSGGEAAGCTLYQTFDKCSSIETVRLTVADKFFPSSLTASFNGCRNLTHIIPILRCTFFGSSVNLTKAFNGCISLKYVKLEKFAVPVSFSDSSYISKESILHTVQNAAPTSAITITLHPDAYARLADDAEIVAALETQPFISLVSA